MIGFLMHKDDVFAKLDIDDYGFRVLEFYTNRFPCKSEPVLHKWFSARQTPYGAGNIADAYKFLDIRTFSDFMKITGFTSINDCFWVKTNSKQTWDNMNLFHNPFTRCLEDIFMGRYISGNINTLKGIYTPCFTNGGSFPKIFKHRDRDIVCIKGSKRQNSDELDSWFTYSEILVSQIYSYLNLVPFVNYSISNFKGYTVCTSKVFSNEQFEYYPAVYYLNGYPSYEEIKPYFCQFEAFYIMLLIDCITFNKDRHTGNYGYMIDSNTGSIVAMNPVYDNNYALFPDMSIKGVTRDNFHLLNKVAKSRLANEPFDSLAVKVIKDYKCGRDILNKLSTFRFTCVGDMQKWRVIRLNNIVNMQCRHILEMI